MTNKQIRAEKSARLFLNPSTADLTDLHCRETVNAILAYGDESSLEPGNNDYDVYLAGYEKKLGTKMFHRICTEQIRDFRKARVFRTIAPDGTLFVSTFWGD